MNCKFERQNQHKLQYVQRKDARHPSLFRSYGRTRYRRPDWRWKQFLLVQTGMLPRLPYSIVIRAYIHQTVWAIIFQFWGTIFTHACLLQVHEQVASARQVPNFHVPFVGSEGYNMLNLENEEFSFTTQFNYIQHTAFLSSHHISIHTRHPNPNPNNLLLYCY